ncbi:DUF6934 family protein [Dyadobacter sp. SG02]|uniref:DUF6934 family protein n=1 Tax=Dyadobacter sp. SG02 TaxID=1855291 RepID=UPI00115F9013|nr:hypothetical protein [Dyadobacter sp. SG02]
MKHINLQTLKEPKYRYKTRLDSLVYKFTSVGLKGEIKKIVIYSLTQTAGVYNLAFGIMTVS